MLTIRSGVLPYLMYVGDFNDNNEACLKGSQCMVATVTAGSTDCFATRHWALKKSNDSISLIFAGFLKTVLIIFLDIFYNHSELRKRD
jgi:hypothetical protein